jgi:ribosomal protein L11 methyltransferase
MSSDFVEVSLQAEVDSGELLARLRDSETLGCWEKDGCIHMYWPESQWTPWALADLKRALCEMGAEIAIPSLEIRHVQDQDWNATWAASLHPIRLGRRVRIRQSWHSPDADFEGVELVIDPKRAFGTGYHATTQLVIEWLEARIRGGERVLDVGTGSGILAMAAIRLGAASAMAIDNDPVALECAREYAAVNGFGPELDLRAESVADLKSGNFDVIVANLDGKTMPLLCATLASLMNAEGDACLSGLQPQDYEEIGDALTRAGLRIKSRLEREDWLSLVVGPC